MPVLTSKTGLRKVCQVAATGGTWSSQKQTKHINVLILIAVKFAILEFPRGKSVRAIHLQIVNMTALTYVFTYLVKMEGEYSRYGISKNIQRDLEFFARQSDHCYIGIFSKQLECSSKLAIQELSRFKLLEAESAYIFSNCENQGSSTIRSVYLMFESSVAEVHVLAAGPRKFSDPYSHHNISIANLAIVHSATLNVYWISNTFFQITLLLSPHGQIHPLQWANQLQVVARMVSGKHSRLKDYQDSPQRLSQIPKGRAYFLVTNWPSVSGLAGVVSKKLTTLQILKMKSWTFWHLLMKKCINIVQ